MPMRLTTPVLIILVAMTTSCSKSNNLVLGRVEAMVGQHKVEVTDCYRISAPRPERLPDLPDGKRVYSYVPCRDAAVIIRGEELVVNGKQYGVLIPGDVVTVDHGTVLVNERAPAVVEGEVVEVVRSGDAAGLLGRGPVGSGHRRDRVVVGEVERLVGVDRAADLLAGAAGERDREPDLLDERGVLDEGEEAGLRGHQAAAGLLLGESVEEAEDLYRRKRRELNEWLLQQRRRSVIPGQRDLLVETFPRAGRYYMTCFPFEGRLAHQTLGMLLTRRLERAALKPLQDWPYMPTFPVDQG